GGFTGQREIRARGFNHGRGTIEFLVICARQYQPALCENAWISLVEVNHLTADREWPVLVRWLAIMGENFVGERFRIGRVETEQRGAQPQGVYFWIRGWQNDVRCGRAERFRPFDACAVRIVIGDDFGHAAKIPTFAA